MRDGDFLDFGLLHQLFLATQYVLKEVFIYDILIRKVILYWKEVREGNGRYLQWLSRYLMKSALLVSRPVSSLACMKVIVLFFDATDYGSTIFKSGQSLK